MSRRISKLAVVGALVGALLAGVIAAPASAATETKTFLLAGQSLTNGKYSFGVQKDGNVVLYDGGRVCWASNTEGLKGTFVQFAGGRGGAYNPHVNVINTAYGINQIYWGAGLSTRHDVPFVTVYYTWADPSTYSLSLNSKGEVWIGYKKWIHC